MLLSHWLRTVPARVRFAQQLRRKARRLPVNRLHHSERLEDRTLLTSPKLISIEPNAGQLLDLQDDSEEIDERFRELTFQFDPGQTLDPATLASGIQMLRSGHDGTFGDGNEVDVQFGFVGIADNPNEVVVRFAQDLPDDVYQITVVGDGADALKNTGGEAFNDGNDFVKQFDLNLGAKVTAVAPQPVLRNQVLTVVDASRLVAGDQITLQTGRASIVFEIDDTSDANALSAAADAAIPIDLSGSPTESDLAAAIASAVSTYGFDGVVTANAETVTFEGGSFSPELILSLSDSAAASVADGDLVQRTDQIIVYFNNDVLDTTAANNPTFYQLIDSADGSILLPASVDYDPASQTAILYFATDLPSRTHDLRIGMSDESNDSSDSATNVGTLFQNWLFATYETPRFDEDGDPIVVDIPDQGTITSPIDVEESFLIADVEVTLDIDHTFGNDLQVFLIGPDGTRVELIRDVGRDVYAGRIYGTKFNDLNANGVQDPNEPGLPGWTIFLDENQNAVLDPGERSTVTDADGNYAFVGLELNETYVVSEVPQSRWQQSTPTSGLREELYRFDFSNGSLQTVLLTGDAMLGDPTEGEFQLSFSGRTTDPIVFEGAGNGAVTAANIEAALSDRVDPGVAVTVTAVSDLEFDVEFTLNGLGTPIDHPILTVASNALDVGTISVLTISDAEGFTSFAAGDPADPIQDEWHLTTRRGNDPGHTGQDSFYFGTGETADQSGQYQSNANGTLVTPEIDLTSPLLTGDVFFEFTHFLDTEASFDFARVDLIDQDGNSFNLLDTSSSTSGFQTLSFNVTDFVGQKIRFQFNFESDFIIVNEGWFVDDVRVLVQRNSRAITLTDAPLDQVAKNVDFGNFRQVVGPDAFGYEAFPVTPDFEDISQTGTPEFQPFQGAGAAFRAGSTGDDQAFDIARDSAGNVYVTGSFQGTVDFDPTGGTSNLTSSGGLDVFVAKYAPSGALLWARSIGGASSDEGSALALDSAGNVYVTGTFAGTVDFDPGAGTANQSSQGNSPDAFLLKLDANGDFVWAQRYGGFGIDAGNGVTVDSNDNVLLAGEFSGTNVDFDPGPGAVPLTSAGGTDAFLLKQSSAGNLIWVRQTGSTGIDRANSVTVDSNNDIIVTGAFSGTVDFDPGAAMVNATASGSTDYYVMKLSQGGAFGWVRTGGSSVADEGNAVTVDASDNVLFTGTVSGSFVVTQFEGVMGGTNWSRQYDGPAADIGQDIAIDPSTGDVFVTGSFRRDLNFGGGVETSNGGADIFVLRLTSAGSFASVRTMGGIGDDIANGLVLDDQSGALIAGSFRDTVDFLTGPTDIPLTSAGSRDAFVARIASRTGEDDASVELDATLLDGFEFDYYGITYGNLFISTNGLITFGSGNASDANGDLTNDPPQATIAPFWEDLLTGSRDSEAVFWEVRGEGDNQRLIIQWSDVRLADDFGITTPLNFQVVLREFDNSIQFNYQDIVRLPSASRVGDELSIGTFSKGNQSDSAIASDASGNHVIVWESPGQDGSGLSIYGRLFDANGVPLVANPNEFQINTTTNGDQLNPAVAMLPTGEFVVVWEGNGPGDGAGVFAQRFNADGSLLGSEIRINDTISGTQANPTVAVNQTDGSFVVAWYGNGSDADGIADSNGIYARRFDSNGDPIGLVDEVQLVEFLGPPLNFQNYTLVFNGQETGSIPYAGVNRGATTASAMQAALHLLPNISDDLTVVPMPDVDEVQTITITGGPTSGTFQLDFAGLATNDITYFGPGNRAATAADIQAKLRLLTNLSNGVTVTEGAHVDEQQTLTFGAATSGGTFKLEFKGETTGDIMFADGDGATTAQRIQDELHLLMGTSTDLTVEPVGGSDTEFVVTFLGADGGQDQPLLILVDDMLTGGSLTIAESVQGQEKYVVTFGGADGSTDQPLLIENANALTPGGTLTFEETVKGEENDDVRFIVTFAGADGGQDQPLLQHGRRTTGVTHMEFTELVQGENGEFRINNYLPGTQALPVIGMEANGNFTVAWQSDGQDGDGWGIYGKRFDADGVELPGDANEVQRITLEGPPAANSTFTLVFNGEETGNITYFGNNSGSRTAGAIQTQLRNLMGLGGTLTVTPIAGDSNEVQRLILTGIDPTGNFRLAHRGQITGQIDIGANGGATATNIQNALQALNNGAGITVAQTNAMDDFDFTITFGGANGGTDHPELLPLNLNLSNGGATVFTVDDGGQDGQTFEVTFTGVDGNQDQPLLELGDNTGGVIAITATEIVQGANSEFQVNTTTVNSQTTPSIAVRPDTGDFVIAWQTDGLDGEGLGVFGQAYAADGTPTSGEFQINSFTESDQVAAVLGYRTDSVSGNGVITAAWQTFGADGDEYAIAARQFNSFGLPLGDEVIVNDRTTDNQTQPAISVFPSGNFVVSWTTQADRQGIHSRVFDSSATQISGEIQASSTFGDRQQGRPRVAKNDVGDFVVVWEDSQRDEDNSAGIYAQTFAADGSPISGEVQVIENFLLDQVRPDVAIDNLGNFVVVWTSFVQDENQPTNPFDVRGRAFDRDGNPLSAEFELATVIDQGQSRAAVAVDPTGSGQFVTAWRDQGGLDGDSFGIFGQRFSAYNSGATDTPPVPAGGQFLLNTITEGTQNNPELTMDATGAFVAVWEGFNPDTNGQNIYARRFDNTGTALDAVEFQVDDDDMFSGSFTAQIAGNATGEFVVVWDGGTGIYSQRFDAAGQRIGPIQRADAAGGDEPSVAINNAGQYIVTWQGSGPSDSFGIVAQRYNASASPIGTNLQINEFTSGDQREGRIGLDDNDQFVVSWLDSGRGGQGVFAQIFQFEDPTGVGIKNAGLQMVGGELLQIWVDGAANPFVNNGSSLRIVQTPTIRERLFAVDAPNNRIVELDPVTGDELNTFPTPEPSSAIDPGMALSASSLFFASEGAQILYELDPDTGAVVDQDSFADLGLTSGITGLAYLNGELVAQDKSGVLHFLDTQADEVVRSVNLGSAVKGGVTGSGARGTLYGVDVSGNLVELDPADGTVLNTFASPYTSPLGVAFAEGLLVVGDRATGEVSALDPDTGAVLSTFSTALGITGLAADGGAGIQQAATEIFQPFLGTELDDEADLPITTGIGPFTGRFIPNGSLSDFDGRNAQGTWRLEIRDTAGDDVGQLLGWEITFNQPEDSPADFTTHAVIGDSVPHDVSTLASDVDFYEFNVLEPGTVRVNVMPTMALDAVIRLFDASGNELASANAGAAGDVEELVFAIANAGTYFAAISSNGNVSYLADGSGVVNGDSTGSYELELRFSDFLTFDDDNSSFATAKTLGNLGAAGVSILSRIEAQPIPLGQYPGGVDEPGHRDIPAESHFGSTGTSLVTPGAITQAFYNFADFYGTDPEGNPLFNLITENQKQRAREIFEIYSDLLGIEFTETASSGIQVVTGDLRAVDPNLPEGPGGVAGVSSGGLGGIVVMDSAENWGDSLFGEGWFGVALHEIGHSLGLGHSYDIISTMGGGGNAEADYPGNQDLVHLLRLHRPDSTDIDVYDFTLTESGFFSAEVFAERLSERSLLNSVLTLYDADGNLIARNDDFYSNDAFIGLRLEGDAAGKKYYIAVTSTGNTDYDLTVSDSGAGGTTDGLYELQLKFVADARPGQELVDATGVALDGNADARPGGVFDFWFQSGETIFVDKLNNPTGGVDGDGSLANPFDTLSAGLDAAAHRIVAPVDGWASLRDGNTFELVDQINPAVIFEFDNSGAASGDILANGNIAVAFAEGDAQSDIAASIQAAVDAAVNEHMLLIAAPDLSGNVVNLPGLQIDISGTPALLETPNLVRIIGQQGDVATRDAYLIGESLSGVTLEDGATFDVPQGVTVMIDEGAVFKLREAGIDVGSSAQLIDRSAGALQVLGTPGNRVFFTSYANDAIGGDDDGPTAGAARSDWGGIVFRADSDLEDRGIYLNFVNQGDFSFAGGRVLVDSVEQTYTAVHAIDARPTVSFNAFTNNAEAPISADPRSFNDDGYNPNAEFIAPTRRRIGLDVHDNYLVDNSINGLFIRIRSESGRPIDRLDVSARIDDTDIVHVLTENLEIVGNPGGPLADQARLSGRLLIDPGAIMKISGSRIEMLVGASNLIAEGSAERPITFTSLQDDTVGIGGTFDTSNNGMVPASPGDWAGFIFRPVSNGSIDQARIRFGGGQTPIEGSRADFNIVEIVQADVRIANSIIESNANGVGTGGSRNGRGTNAPAAIFVRNAQPIIVHNVFRDNAGSVIHINVNALGYEPQTDIGRTTGRNARYAAYDDNRGPLVAGNLLENNGINGMEVRAEELTTESIWDDTGIVHVLRGEVVVDNHHTLSGLRLQSRPDASLVVKLAGANAGFTATGTLIDIDDRIGGTVQIVGAPGFPVFLTSLADDSVGAGFQPDGLPSFDTNNDGPSAGSAGQWRGIRLEELSNDRNVRVLLEREPAITGGVDINRLTDTAQPLGEIAPSEQTGDDNRPVGFEVHGHISPDAPSDRDVYSFQAEVGTEVWIDLDRTASSLDSVVELINQAGTVIASSDNSFDNTTLTGLAVPLTKASYLGGDYYSANRLDAGFRVTLPGTPGTKGTYYVRVRSKNALTSGEYQLQIRVNQRDDKPGSTITFSDIRYATTGIEVLGLPGHSPLLGEYSGGAGGPNVSIASLGNLLESDRNTISVAGRIDGLDDVKFYTFDIDYEFIQSIGGVNDGGKTWSTVFDIDYADGFGRPDTTLGVYDENGRLILLSRSSNVEDDRPAPGQGSDLDDLTRGSIGALDPFLGSVQMPEGTNCRYIVAVSHDASLPEVLNQTFVQSATAFDVRLEPVNGVLRIAEDHIGFSGYTSGTEDLRVPVQPVTSSLFDIGSEISLSTQVRPFSLEDVVLFVNATNRLYTVDPFQGALETNIGALTDMRDIDIRTDGRLYGYRGVNNGANTAGALVEINASNAAALSTNNDNIPDFNPQTNPPDPNQVTTDNVDALAFRRTDVAEYDLYYSVRDGVRSRLYRANPATGSAATAQNQPWGLVGTITGVSGRTTGMQFVGGTLYGVSDAGEFYTISTASGATSLIANFGQSFQGLELGPQNLQGGAYSNTLFAVTSGGTLTAFSPFGTLQSIFDTDGDGVANSASLTLGVGGLTGLAFSPLDYNLWHPTTTRGTDGGHGVNDAFDLSRSPSDFDLSLNGRDSNEGEGGASFYFGLEQYNDNFDQAYFKYQSAGQLGVLSSYLHEDLTTNPTIGGNYNLPGGAHGSLITNSFSLSGYSSQDRPTLYFNYFLATEGANGDSMRDSARVFISSNGGNSWSLLATNNSQLDNELPEFLSHSGTTTSDSRQRVQELFDNSDSWRQARVDLGDFAGASNLQLRFDFATAGGLNESGLPGESNSEFFDPLRGQDNSHEGFYIDDIIIGFAERGEMVTNAPASNTNYFEWLSDPDMLGYQRPESGPFQLEIRRGTEYALPVSDADPEIFIYWTPDPNQRQTADQLLLGDDNLHRDQGHVRIDSNLIRDFSDYGIVVDAVRGPTTEGSRPYPGSPINFGTLNNDRLAPGVIIVNNVVANVGNGGIRYSGDAAAGPTAPVPFGKIANNTVYGGQSATGVGIRVEQNASPTLLNNIVANTSTAIQIDGTSNSTVVDTSLFQGNGNNGTVGQNAILLASGDPLFVNPAQNNFYLAPMSLAIDSSLNSLADRANFVNVKSPLGLLPSDLFAPNLDLYGQLRVDDDTQDPFPGLGDNIFKDRGAVERADFTGPTARIVAPVLDNSQNDLDPTTTIIHVDNPFLLTEFIVELLDDGIGIDDLNVLTSQFELRQNGRLLVEDEDYQFVYNTNTNQVIFRSLTVFESDRRYTISIDNSVATGVRDLAGNPLQPNQTDGSVLFTILVTDGVNDPPINSVPGPQDMLEDGSLVFSASDGNAITVTDDDAYLGRPESNPNFSVPHGVLRVTLTVSAGMMTLSDTTGLTFGTGDGTDDATMTFSGTIADINAALEGLTYTPPQDAFGTETLTIMTEDLGNFGPPPLDPQSDVDVIQINIAEVNDVPSFTIAGDPPTIKEDDGPQTVSGFATNISTGAPNEVQGLTFTVTVLSTTSNLVFTSGPAIDPGSGDLTYTVADDANGDAFISVVLTDDGVPAASSAAQFFSISVTALNDAPQFTLPSRTVNSLEDDPMGTVTVADFATDIRPGNVTSTDESGQELTFFTTVTSASPTLAFTDLPSVDPDSGTLTYRSAPDSWGTATVEIYLEDDGNDGVGEFNTSAVETFTIVVAATPDAPVADAGGDYTIDAGDALQLDASASFDVDFHPTVAPNEGIVSYSWDLDGDGNEDATGVAPLVDWSVLNGLGLTSGEHTITLTVTDNTNRSDTDTALLTVVIVDYGDAPDSYGTLRSSNGAAHEVNTTVTLGSLIDTEFGASVVPGAGADGDDLNNVDDEDGVTIQRLEADPVDPLPGTITVEASEVSKLDAWIDFNGNGQFDHATEHLNGGVSFDLVPGTNVLTITVPAVTVPDAGLETYARFRVSSAGGLLPTGRASDGEVEDYRLTLHKLTPPVQPLIETPPDAETSDHTPTISWTGDDSNFNYRLRLIDLTTNTEVLNLGNLLTTSYTLTDPLPDGPYRIIVTAYNRRGDSVDSQPKDFVVETIALSSPLGSVIDATPDFNWNAIDGSSEYVLTVYDSNGLVEFQEPVASNEFKPAEFLPTGQYQAQVQAFNSLGQPGDASALANFEVIVPTLTAPLDEFEGTRPTFAWTDIGANRYELQVDNVDTGLTEFFESLTTSSFTSPRDLPEGTYSFRVRAFAGATADTVGNWTEFEDFILTIPVPAPPAFTATPALVTIDATPSFAWNSVEHAVSYDFLYFRVPDGEQSATVITGIAGQQTTITPPVIPGLYRARVRGRNLSNEPGPYNTYYQFEVNPQVAPTLLMPEGEQYTSTPTFRWTNIDASRYDLWVANLTLGDSQYLRRQNLTSTSFTPQALPDGQYRAWVRGFNDDNVTGKWSTAVDFTVTNRTVTPIAPSGTTIDFTPTFQWTAVGSATHYDLWVSPAGQTQPVIRQPLVPATSSTTVSYTSATQLARGQYRFWVRAYQNDTAFAWSAPLDFEVTTSVRPTLVSPSGTTFDSTPQFSWLSVNGASRYDLWVDSVTTGTSQVIRRTNLQGTFFSPSTPLPNGTYRASLRAINDNGAGSRWSQVLEFTVNNNLRPTFTGPTSPASTLPLIQWDAVPGADGYDVWLDNRSTGATGLINQTVFGQQSYQTTTALQPGDYRVWVRARSLDGSAGKWKSFDFTVASSDVSTGDDSQPAPELQGDLRQTQAEFVLVADSSSSAQFVVTQVAPVQGRLLSEPSESVDDQSTEMLQRVAADSLDGSGAQLDAVMQAWHELDWWSSAAAKLDVSTVETEPSQAVDESAAAALADEVAATTEPAAESSRPVDRRLLALLPAALVTRLPFRNRAERKRRGRRES